MNISLPSITSAAFWSSIAGVASIVCGSLNVGSSMSSAIQALLVAIGGIFIAVPAHHVIAAQQAAAATPATPAAPVVPPVAA